MTTLGEKIRQLRQAKGFSQEELAAHLNVSRQAVSKWEKSLSYPDTENLLALAALFEVSADELAGIRRGENANEHMPEESAAAGTEKKSELPRKRPGLAAAGIALLAVLLLWGVFRKEGDSTPPDASDPPAQNIPAQSDPAQSDPAQNIPAQSDPAQSDPAQSDPAQSDPVPGDPVQNDPSQSEPAGSNEPTGAETLPPPWSPVEEMGEFALRWMAADGWEHLAVGQQEGLFPFGTSLRPTEMEKVYDTDFRSMTLHVVACGDLSVQYSHILEDGMGTPATEWVESVTTIVPGCETPRGISVGSGEKEVLRRYGDALIYVVKDSGAGVLCKHDYKYVYAPETAFGTAVIFYISDGQVAGLEIRANDDSGNEAWRVDHMYRFPVKNGEPDFGQRQEPERQEVEETWAVYIALHALKNDANLSAAEEFGYRQTIFQNLQYLDWGRYGKLGEAGKDDLTRSELLNWLERQATLSADEISGLLAGMCRSNLDGWVAESYIDGVIAGACAAYPVEYVKAMAAETFTDAERETILDMTAHACWWNEQNRGKILSALERDPLRYTDAERVWAEELARRIRAIAG